MAVKLESGQHRVLKHPPSAAQQPLYDDPQMDKFGRDLMKYQQRKRCRPWEDFKFSSVGGMAMGGMSGGVVAAVPGLALMGVGALVTGAAGLVAGGMLGGLVGASGGVLVAASHLHVHTPDAQNLSRHVFSQFGVVPFRHQSRRITQQLVKHEVLHSDETRRVVSLDAKRIRRALKSVRVFGTRLTPKQCIQVSNILRVQNYNIQVAEARNQELTAGHNPT